MSAPLCSQALGLTVKFVVPIDLVDRAQQDDKAAELAEEGDHRSNKTSRSDTTSTTQRASPRQHAHCPREVVGAL